MAVSGLEHQAANQCLVVGSQQREARIASTEC